MSFFLTSSFQGTVYAHKPRYYDMKVENRTETCLICTRLY